MKKTCEKCQFFSYRACPSWDKEEMKGIAELYDEYRKQGYSRKDSFDTIGPFKINEIDEQFCIECRFFELVGEDQK